MQIVLRNKIKNLLKEYFESQQTDYSQSIKKDITYLKDFNLKNQGTEDGYNFWVYYFDTHGNSYKIICVVTNDIEKDIWNFKSEVYWSGFDKRKTPGSGMEYEIEIENVCHYDNFVSEVNRKLNSSPLSNSDVYHDDYNFMMTKEIVKELIRLIVNYPKIEALNNSDLYEPLKKLYNDTIDLSVKDTIDYIQNNYPADGDKQMIIYKLNSMDSLANFTEIDKLNITPKDETVI